MSALHRKLFAGFKELGLDEDTRRDLIEQATGVRSLSGMSDANKTKVLKALEARGFKASKAQRFKRAARGDTRYIHVLWRILGEAGVLKRPDRAGLNAFVRARFGEAWGSVPMDIDQLVDAQKITAVIKALEAMCKREGVSYAPDRR
ncbi:MAG: regulatory protein GemA [Pseudomonadota bacterium]